MAMTVMIASGILLTKERHLGLRHSLSETRRILTSSCWAASHEGLARSRDSPVAHHHHDGGEFSRCGRREGRIFPASFMRFVWFCTALFIGLLAYVIGESYAEVYLRALPHSSLDTIVYVYGWISTVYLLDGLTGWILGGNQWERMGIHPLSWVFKL